MINIDEHLCGEAVQLASSLFLRSISIARSLLGMLGIACVVILLQQKGISWVPNRNAKALYLGHLYLNFHVSIFFMLLYIFLIFRSFLPIEDACSFILDARLSCLIKIVPVLGIHAQSFNMLSFAIERAVSTVWPEKYEKTTSPLLGIVLVFFSISVTIVIDFSFVFLPIPSSFYVSGVTARNAYNLTTYQMTNYIVFATELTTISIFSFTYYLNVKKSQNMTKLGDKYQIVENKKVIRTLLPCFLVHFFLNAVSYFLQMLYPVFYPQFDLITSTIYLEIVSQAQTYTIILPLIILCRKEKQTTVVHSVKTASDMYFQQLNTLFDVK